MTDLSFGGLLVVALGAAAGLAFGAVGWVRSPLLVGVALSATSLDRGHAGPGAEPDVRGGSPSRNT